MAKKRGKSKVNKPESIGIHPKKPETDDISMASVSQAAATSGANPVLVNLPLKICRLCEIKEGPFLNIFDPDRIIAQKVQQLMPFVVAENDDLPHKICFRCSAKVEELHEFIQKCIKTQQSLRVTMNKNTVSETRISHINKWEERLVQSKVTNDDICEVVIKRAMQHMKEINQNVISNGVNSHAGSSTVNNLPKVSTLAVDPAVKSEAAADSGQIENNKTNIDESSNKRTSLRKNVQSPRSDPDRKLTRSSRTNTTEPLMDGLVKVAKRKKPTTSYKAVTSDDTTKLEDSLTINANEEPIDNSGTKKESIKSLDEASKKQNDKEAANKQTLPKSGQVMSKQPHEANAVAEETDKTKDFDIMDYVSTIKVNGVGVLFQCKLCNRNFLKQEVVLSHGCAKHRAPIEQVACNKTQAPQAPKAPTVKYINTKQDTEVKNTTTDKSDLPNDHKSAIKGDIKMIAGEAKPKPRIGPASRVKRQYEEPVVGMVVQPRASSPPKPAAPALSVKMPIVPSVNSTYKLVPGPNNTFTLVEDQLGQNSSNTLKPISETQNNDNVKVLKPVPRSVVPLSSGTNTNIKWTVGRGQSTMPSQQRASRKSVDVCYTISDDEVIDIGEEKVERQKTQPYPIGLYQSVPRVSDERVAPTPMQLPVFGVPASKKHTYTIVKTDNPNKLLISSKPQLPQDSVPQPKRARQSAPGGDDTSRGQADGNKYFNLMKGNKLQHYHQQSNYGAQTSTTQQQPVQGSNNLGIGQDYTCNICPEKFSRESKLQAHIQAHYTKMDQEVNEWSDKTVKKRGKKLV